MRKITGILKSDPKKKIFAEEINYFSVGKASIWGDGDSDTLDVLNATSEHFNWLDLSAGDGRYTQKILPHSRNVVASDIDPGALSKLWFRIPADQSKKLSLVQMNLISHLPFRNHSFDGVLCTGSLHFFEISTLKKILIEMDRVVIPGGNLIFDFAFGIQREKLDGSKTERLHDENYPLFPNNLFSEEPLTNYQIKTKQSFFVDDLSSIHGYISKGFFAIVVAKKPL